MAASDRPVPKTVADTERRLFGSVTSSKSPRQRRIREALREIGLGVGNGHRYLWDENEFGRLAKRLGDKLRYP